MKKTPGDIIIHKCTKNHDHMLHCSLDIACDGCKFCFSFWIIFYSFTPLTAKKIKIKKNEKIARRYHHFTHVCKNKVPEMWCATDGPTAKVTIEVGTPPKKLILKRYVSFNSCHLKQCKNNLPFTLARQIFTTAKLEKNVWTNFKSISKI